MKTLIVLGFGLIVGISPVFSQNINQKNDSEQNKIVSGTYVDADKNGVCDNYSDRHKNAKSNYYVDKDNNGVCDNYTIHGKRHGYWKRHKNGHNAGYGYKHRHGLNN